MALDNAEDNTEKKCLNNQTKEEILPTNKFENVFSTTISAILPIDVDTLDSPPIQIATIGVLRDQVRDRTRLEQIDLSGFIPEDEEKWEDASTNVFSNSRDSDNDYLMFSSPLSTNPVGLMTVDIPPLGFLDAIVEEDSDDLRSCQSSRASSTRYSGSSRTLSSSANNSGAQSSRSGPEPTAEQQIVSAHIEQIIESAEQQNKNATENEEDQPTEGRKTPVIPKLKLDTIDTEQEESLETPSTSARSKSESRLKHSSSSSLDSSETETVLESANYSKQKQALEELKELRDKENPQISIENISTEETSTKVQKPKKTVKINTKSMFDADRDQMEVLVPTSDQFSCFTPLEDGRISSTSMSINLDRSRDSLLDQSVCSNPTKDENSAIVVNRIVSTTATLNLESRKRRAFNHSSDKASSTSSEDEEEALPPPPQVIEIVSNTNLASRIADKAVEDAIQEVASKTPSTYRDFSPARDMPTSPIPKLTTVERVTISSRIPATATITTTPIKPTAESVQRISSFVYGYGGHLNQGTQTTATNPPTYFEANKENREIPPQSPLLGFETEKPLGFESHLKQTTTPTKTITTTTTTSIPVEPLNNYFSCVSPQEIFDSYELRRHPYAQSKEAAFITRSRRDMDVPPNEAPPPPPPKSYVESVGYRTDAEMSRDDLISESGHRSRSTVREIPIQRSSSAFQPSIMSSMLGGVGGTHGNVGAGAAQNSGIFSGGGATGSAIPYSNASTVYATKYQNPNAPQQEEYYRREVLTRTLVTRSTEALSAPPLSRSSPVIVTEHLRQLPEPNRDEVSEEYWYKYSRNVEEEERRIRENQRKKEEEERRQREEDQRRRWEQQEMEHLERLRRERELMEKDLEYQIMEREKLERERIEKDRLEREALELRRRQEWERLERERRDLEEIELEKRRQLERLEKERLERERLERERLELERLERERLQQEKIEKERVERERIERERIEIERLEIERIERIKREQREKEQKERERQREEAERIERERLEADRLARERLELERREREYLEMQRREAEQRERERREDERLEKLRREQERLEFEQMEAERRERQRQEDERREQELLDAQLRARERREQERLEENRKEALRQEEERREQERRQRERMEAQERERQRIIEEQRERERVAALEAAAAERRAQRMEEERLQRNRAELERHTEDLKEIERREAEKREKERLEEERRLAELRDLERRNAELRDAERREAAEREANRRREDRRSRDRLDLIVKEREECERWENERRRLLAERENQERKRQALTSKETLERLTRKPYYSRENLSLIGMPEVTTKVERQIIERVDRTLWTNDDVRPVTSSAIPLTSHQHHYTSSTGGAPIQPYSTSSGNAMAPSLLFDHQRNTSASPLFTGASTHHQDEFSSGGALKDLRERIYNPRLVGTNALLTAEEELKRGGSARTSKYKAKMEKARKDFLHQDPSNQNDIISERFQKSTEDLRRRVEYRGPLLQKFHSGEFTSSKAGDLDLPSTLNYSRVGPSPYDQEYQKLLEKAERSLSRYRTRASQPSLYSPFQSRARHFSSDVTNFSNLRHVTNMDDVHRSKSVLGGEIASPNRQSRKEAPTNGQDPEAAQHSRSKSADYLLDQRIRENVIAPENELQKCSGGDSHHASQRREGSDWYPTSTTTTRYEQQISPQYPTRVGHPTTTSTTEQFTTYEKSYRDGMPSSAATQRPLTLHGNQPWSYTGGYTTTSGTGYERERSSDYLMHGRTPTSPPIGGISFPAGMFDKYKDEIEDLRRSRTSLHQLVATTPQEHTKDFSKSLQPLYPDTSTTREYSREAFSKTDINKLENARTGRQLPGYTVYSVPREWNIQTDPYARVVEVADTFIEKSEAKKTTRFGGRITAEEVLDSIFESTSPANDPIDISTPQPHIQNIEGPGIFPSNYDLMNKVMDQPHLAESILNEEPLFVRCQHCNKSRMIREARRFYVTCKHCYSYYCSRECRQQDWEKHRDECSFARINTLCKEVIMKVRRDPETQYYMSRVAREGFKKEGRGSVNIRLISAHSAQLYLQDGWKVFANHDPNQLLFYYPINSLVEQRKEPSLIHLCRKYNPNDKFILSVSIIADIEQCPVTPPGESLLNQANDEIRERQEQTRAQSTQPHYNNSSVYSAVVPTNV